MVTAFILINTDLGSENEILKEIKNISDVKEAHSVSGIYDIIARIETDSMQKLKDIISWEIRQQEKIRSTRTMIVN
jgi:DNA-binding Lrp family transcriptional regulator